MIDYMKNIFLYAIALFGIWMSSCDNLPDEQFEKYVIMSRNGFQTRSFEYQKSGFGTTDIAISVSGTSVISHDISVKVAIDETALYNYNFDNFREDVTLYYTLLPADSYELGSEMVTIQAGHEYGLLPVKVDLAKLDMKKNYVLPLTIVSTSDYSVGPVKYATILMNVVLENGFSGEYAASAKIRDYTIYRDESDPKKQEEKQTFNFSGVRNLFVLDDKTCYLYGGNVSEESVARDKYRIQVVINPDSTLTLTSMNPDIEFIQQNTGTTPGSRSNYIVIRDTIINSNAGIVTRLQLDYRYTNHDPLFPEDFAFRGTLTQTKELPRIY